MKGNLSGAAFPLFTTQMYKALSFKWANTLFGCLAVILVPIPFVCVPLFPRVLFQLLNFLSFRFFSFMDQLLGNEASSRELLWAYN